MKKLISLWILITCMIKNKRQIDVEQNEHDVRVIWHAWYDRFVTCYPLDHQRFHLIIVQCVDACLSRTWMCNWNWEKERAFASPHTYTHAFTHTHIYIYWIKPRQRVSSLLPLAQTITQTLCTLTLCTLFLSLSREPPAFHSVRAPWQIICSGGAWIPTVITFRLIFN